MGYKISKGFMWVRGPKLPTEYQEVEYIESSGTSCGINTGITPHDTSFFEIEFKMNPTTLKSSGNYFYGTNSSGAWNSFEYTSSNGSYWNVGSSTLIGTLSPNLSTGTDYIFDCKYSGNNGGTLTVSGTYSKSVSYSGSTGTKPLYFFCQGDDLGGQSADKLYYLKIYTGDSEANKSLVRDFVPCYRKSDNVIGLYDLVNDQFYTNSGSGTFSKGNDVTPTYEVKEKQFYPGVPPTPPTPPAVEIYYDLRGGSMNGLNAAGFNGIYTDGSYSFYSDGLGQTSGSNDRNTYVWTNQLDLSNATKVTIECLGYWYAGSWSNAKWLELRGNFDGSTDTNPCFNGCINLNTSSASSYSFNGLYYVNSSGSGSNPAGSYYASYTGDTTMTQVWDLVNKTWTLTHTGANSNSFSTALSDAQVAEVKACKAAKFGWGRGYSDYNNERLKTVYVKVE